MTARRFILPVALLTCCPVFAASPKELAQHEIPAAKKDTRAMIALGLAYHQGDGVPVDYGKAMDWHLKAYDEADGDALNNLGVMHREIQSGRLTPGRVWAP